MGRHLTKSRTAGYGLPLTAVGISAWSLSYVRLTAQADGATAALMAAWGSSNTVTDIYVNGLRPDKTEDYILSVTNMGDGMINEVGQDYSIRVEITGNLPLEFAFTPEINSPDHGRTFVKTRKNGKSILNNGIAVVKGDYLSHSVSVIYTCTLAATWPEEQTGAEHADEIDLMTLTVSSEQTIPVE